MASSPLLAQETGALCKTPEVAASLARATGCCGTTIVVWPVGAQTEAKPGGGTVIVIWPRNAEAKLDPGNGSIVIIWPRKSAAGCCGGRTVAIWPFAPESEAKAADCGSQSVIAWPLSAKVEQKRGAGNGSTIIVWPFRAPAVPPDDNGIVVVWPTGSGRAADINTVVVWPDRVPRPVRCPPEWLSDTSDTAGGISLNGKCRKLSAEKLSVPALPPDGTLIGDYGVVRGGAAYAWGTKDNGGGGTIVIVWA